MRRVAGPRAAGDCAQTYDELASVSRIRFAGRYCGDCMVRGMCASLYLTVLPRVVMGRARVWRVWWLVALRVVFAIGCGFGVDLAPFFADSMRSVGPGDSNVRDGAESAVPDADLSDVASRRMWRLQTLRCRTYRCYRLL
jgi:hypothetical protein